MRFTGDEREIDLNPEGHKPEFDAWRWAPASEVLDEIVGFKRDAYDAVVDRISPSACPLSNCANGGNKRLPNRRSGLHCSKGLC